MTVQKDGREKRSECDRASDVKLRPLAVAGHGPITHGACFRASHACEFAPNLTG